MKMYAARKIFKIRLKKSLTGLERMVYYRSLSRTGLVKQPRKTKNALERVRILALTIRDDMLEYMSTTHVVNTDNGVT